ncbi:MAG: hypothetical protein R3B93_06805 [Bacteroidia bacterium]
MKETRLGDFEETILLLVGILDKEVYAFRIAGANLKLNGASRLNRGSTLPTLSRLADKDSLLRNGRTVF